MYKRSFSGILIIVFFALSTLLWSGCAAAAPESAAAGGEAPANLLRADNPADSAGLSPVAASVTQKSAVEEGSSGAPIALTNASDMTAPDQRRIIGRAMVELVVSNPQAAMESITRLMDESGGYVANVNLYKASYADEAVLQGTLTLRVPAERLDATLTELEKLAVEVRTKNLNREDVTDQYTDLDAQLRNLEATENELRELLAEVRAKPNARPEDILTVHAHLTQIRGQIEQVQGRKNMLDNLIGLSTIEVTLTPDVGAQPVVEEGWRPQVAARQALRALVNTLQGLTNVAIWVGLYLLPIVLIVGVGVGIVFVLIRFLLQGIALQKSFVQRSRH